MSTQSDQIRKHVLNDRIREALAILQAAADIHAKDEVLALQSRLGNLERNDRLGTLSNDDVRTERSKIRMSTLSLLRTVFPNEAVPQELHNPYLHQQQENDMSSKKYVDATTTEITVIPMDRLLEIGFNVAFNPQLREAYEKLLDRYLDNTKHYIVAKSQDRDGAVERHITVHNQLMEEFDQLETGHIKLGIQEMKTLLSQARDTIDDQPNLTGLIVAFSSVSPALSGTLRDKWDDKIKRLEDGANPLFVTQALTEFAHDLRTYRQNLGHKPT